MLLLLKCFTPCLIGMLFSVCVVAHGVVTVSLFLCRVAVSSVPCLLYVAFLFCLDHVFFLCRVVIVEVSLAVFFDSAWKIVSSFFIILF